VVVDLLRPPLEVAQIVRQLAEAGSKSLLLVIASGFALGTVMAFQTRSTQDVEGADALSLRMLLRR
jgi:phospholipid/cholesterol/gamma-HCH transport system permease protein